MVVLEEILRSKERAIQEVRDNATIRIAGREVLYKGAKIEHLDKGEMQDAMLHLAVEYKKLHNMYIANCKTQSE